MSLKCNHNISIGTKCWGCVYQNNSHDFKDKNIKANPIVNKNISNYTETNLKKNPKDVGNFFEQNIIQSKQYISPNINPVYPSVINEWKPENSLINLQGSTSNCIEQNNRKNITRENLFMERSVQSIPFINNSKNIQSHQISDSFQNDTNLGINTRSLRKMDDCDLHLKRSMMQPDIRHGNRFYEIKPTNTRRDNYRGIGNENVMKFQNQTEKMYRDMNLSKSYDIAAGMNRGSI